MSLPQVGDVKYSDSGTRMVYGPDPWAWNVTFLCWFSLDEYLKEQGKAPDYVSDADLESLGLRHRGRRSP